MLSPLKASFSSIVFITVSASCQIEISPRITNLQGNCVMHVVYVKHDKHKGHDLEKEIQNFKMFKVEQVILDTKLNC